MALIIGLTGSIASGKSTVSNMFRAMDVPVIDADMVAREVVEIDGAAYEQVVQAFGKGILAEDQTLNRKKLGNIIFHNKEKRLLLNNIMHPAIHHEIEAKKEQYLKEGHRVIVLDIPLLFEGGNSYKVDKVLVVYVDEDIQLQRLMERNELTKEEALARVATQISIEEKRRLADDYIDNRGSISESEKQLKRILAKWGVSL